MGLGVVLHVKLLLQVVVKRLRLVKVHNLLDGSVVLDGVRAVMVERLVGWVGGASESICLVRCGHSSTAAQQPAHSQPRFDDGNYAV